MLTPSRVSHDASPEARELAGDRAGAEQELDGEVALLPRHASAARPTAGRCRRPTALANLYCDEGRWDEAEECLATTGPARAEPR